MPRYLSPAILAASPPTADVTLAYLFNLPIGFDFFSIYFAHAASNSSIRDEIVSNPIFQNSGSDASSPKGARASL